MKKLIINADDFGYRKEINRGVIYAHQNGLVTSASLFMEKEGSDEAITLAKSNPGLGLGIHLDLDSFFDVDHHLGVVTGIKDQPGIYEDIGKEARRQLNLYYSLGFTADHVDSHHHAHLYPGVFPVVCRLAKEFKIPIVRVFQKYFNEQKHYEDTLKTISETGVKCVDHFIEGWYWGNVDETYQVAELMTHPGYGEIWREAELAHCCQPQLKQYLVEHGIELQKFSDISA